MAAIQNIDIAKIIKRLELIKSLILLEEEDEISAHIFKLEQLILPAESQSIIDYLKNKSYSKAVIAIEAFINQHNNLTIYIDPELGALKLEAKILERELNNLSDEKADIEKLIHEFGVRHNNELGSLILKILIYLKDKAKDTPEEAEAENNYNEYSQEYEISKDEKIIELNEDDLKELKQKYRAASKLCHPDVVNEEQKELAEKLFTELNAAYERNDLQKVNEILLNLENGSFFVSKSDAINEKVLLKAEIEKLLLRIKELNGQMQVIKNSEAFITVSSISDWDAYFKETKEKLTAQVMELENGRK